MSARTTEDVMRLRSCSRLDYNPCLEPAKEVSTKTVRGFRQQGVPAVVMALMIAVFGFLHFASFGVDEAVAKGGECSCAGCTCGSDCKDCRMSDGAGLCLCSCGSCTKADTGYEPPSGGEALRIP